MDKAAVSVQAPRRRTDRTREHAVTDAPDLHQDMIVIDGLIISNFSRSVFEDMRRGGLTAANCTCCVWENFEGTMRNIARWNRHFADHADLLV